MPLFHISAKVGLFLEIFRSAFRRLTVWVFFILSFCLARFMSDFLVFFLWFRFSIILVITMKKRSGLFFRSSIHFFAVLSSLFEKSLPPGLVLCSPKLLADILILRAPSWTLFLVDRGECLISCPPSSLRPWPHLSRPLPPSSFSSSPPRPPRRAPDPEIWVYVMKITMPFGKGNMLRTPENCRIFLSHALHRQKMCKFAASKIIIYRVNRCSKGPKAINLKTT